MPSQPFPKIEFMLISSWKLALSCNATPFQPFCLIVLNVIVA
jgi:hypothetical protein